MLLASREESRVRAAVAALSGAAVPGGAWVRVSGYDLTELPGTQRRLLVGVAGCDDVLERGTVARAVRYRDPDGDVQVAAALARVGLVERVAGLEKGERTQLRRGGEPLSTAERTRLLLARAAYGDPPLVVLDRIDTRLGEGGREILADLWATYPGVLAVASEAPAARPGPVTEWDLDRGTAGHAAVTLAGAVAAGRDRDGGAGGPAPARSDGAARQPAASAATPPAGAPGE
ncbi:hypothetical protein [Georgenia sp. AZ-5]|uniref:hypothetical protein n=1 Tax=Georgenia sp. AZ-5 TaxID=3367526 RepID=UPI00375434FF